MKKFICTNCGPQISEAHSYVGKSKLHLFLDYLIVQC